MDEGLTHDDKTLDKAFYSIWRIANGKLTDQEVRDCISEMLNDGLRIREITKEN